MIVNIYTDGGAKGNPGKGAWAFIITNHKGDEIFRASGSLTRVTNNEAEYTAVLYGLRKAVELEATRIRIHCDSDLVVEQINRGMKVKAENLRQYVNSIRSIKTPFKISWLNRENPMIRQCDWMVKAEYRKAGQDETGTKSTCDMRQN